MTLLDDTTLSSLVRATLDAVRREYPHKLDQELNADDDLHPPRLLNPSFYGSYDWHSAVHNHWLVVRAVARGLPAELEAQAIALLDEHLSEERIEAERTFFTGPGGRTSERPYGWAWLVALHAECEVVAVDGHRRWAAALAPLATLLSGRLERYFDSGLAFPIRTGTHGNTAFSLHVTLEAARRRGDTRQAEALAGAARRFYIGDTSLPWAEAPAGDAFLAAPLVEAALMAEVLDADELAGWLDRSLPEPSAAMWEPPQFTPDGADPGTVHLEGLLISRAWCLDALARALPGGHAVRPVAAAATAAHLERVARLQPTDGFNRSHWVPTFLLYLDERLRRA